jgi:hypothetical protein
MERGPAVDLLANAIDYAGLFPPAALSMAEAIAEYDAARTGPLAWTLGRFVLPASRLEEFAQHAAGAEWQLSAIVRDRSEADREAIVASNAAQPRARVDSIECKPESEDGLDWLAASFADPFEVYVEVPAGNDAARWLEAVAARGLRGKVRTGGITAAAFPQPSDLVTFIEAAVKLRLPFKATAGLHHAARGSYPLTYDANPAQAPMYGYLNVFLATAALVAGLPRTAALDILQQTNTSTLDISHGIVRWGGVELPAASVREMRTAQLLSFGSCSFREPTGEYLALFPFIPETYDGSLSARRATAADHR